MADLAVINQADLEKLSDPKPFLEEVGVRFKTMLEEASALTVNNEASAKIATEKAQSVRLLLESLEKQRKIIVEPFKEHTGNVDRMFKEPRDSGNDVVQVYAGKVSHYAIEERRKAKELAEQERKRLEKNYTAQVKRADDAGRDAPTPPAIPEAVIPKQVVAGAPQREVWDFEVVDINRIPARYLEVKRGKILQALAGGEVIVGIKAEKKTVTSFAT